MSRPRVAVIGSGLTALLVAHHLDADVEVVPVPAAVDGSDPVRADGPLDLPARFDAEAARLATEGCAALGLGPAAAWWQPTGPVRVWIDDHLRTVPAGPLTTLPLPLSGVVTSRVLSPLGLATLATGALRCRRHVAPGDRSAADLVDTCFGVEVRERLVAPYLAATAGGTPEELSAACELPELWAERHRPPATLRPATAPAVLAGCGVLEVPAGWAALVHRLHGSIEPRRWTAPAVSIGHDAHGPVVHLPGRVLEVDAVVVTTSATEAVRLLAEAYPGVARELHGIGHRTLVEVTLDHDAASVPPGAERGVLLVPPRARRHTAWLDHHTGEAGGPVPGTVRTRAVLRPDVAATVTAESDEERLLHVVDAEVRRALRIRRPAPHRSVRRWVVPLRTVGHGARLDRLVHQLDQVPAGVHLGGPALRGLGAAARLHDAGRLAHEVRWQLAHRPRRADRDRVDTP